MIDPVTQFSELVQLFAGVPGVTEPDATKARGFGSDALKVGGSIFAMVARGHLVVKLPKARVDELIAAGEGMAFDAGRGRPMREWVALVSGDLDVWCDLATEARAFVGGGMG